MNAKRKKAIGLAAVVAVAVVLSLFAFDCIGGSRASTEESVQPSEQEIVFRIPLLGEGQISQEEVDLKVKGHLEWTENA